MADTTEKSRYFPWLPGRWTYVVVAKRIPTLGEFFLEKDQVFKCANGYRGTKPREILQPVKQV